MASSSESPARASTRSRADAQRRERVLGIARTLSATIGANFFHSMVRGLAGTLNADTVYLAEVARTTANTIQTLAVFTSGSTEPNFQLELSGTAAGQVLTDGWFGCTKDVRRTFPLDPHLGEVAAEGYAGIRLSDASGLPIGLLALSSQTPLADTQLVRSVLEAFVPRAAVELARKRDEEVQRENEERYHAFVTSNPDAMWRIEFEQPIPLDLPAEEQIERIYHLGYLAEGNDALARLFGRSRAEELRGWRFEDFAPRSDAALQEELRMAVRSRFGPIVVERTLVGEDGRAVDRLRSQFGIVEDGQLRRLWGSTRDMTELRRAERAAAASERRFREVLEGIHLPAVILDARGVITFCNERFLQLAERARAELSTLTWMEGIVSPEESGTWRTAGTTGSNRTPLAQHFEGAVIPRAGAPRMLLWDTICLGKGAEEAPALAAIGRDITYQRALEAQVRQAQKLDSIGRLAAGVAHDFNNFLTVILGNSSQLQSRVPETDPVYAGLSEITNAARLCARLTEQLLAFGRQSPLNPERINLSTLVDSAEGLIRSLLGPGIELALHLESTLRAVDADPVQIQRVLANLAANARDAMPQGGTLTIATVNREIADDDAGHPGVARGLYVQLSVTDTGPGLPAEVSARIFEPFLTTKPFGKGLGLGLATVYGIVTQSGGHIAVRSEAGKGTTFDILFPAAPVVVH